MILAECTPGMGYRIDWGPHREVSFGASWISIAKSCRFETQGDLSRRDSRFGPPLLGLLASCHNNGPACLVGPRRRHRRNVSSGLSVMAKPDD
jgi:hypothetical protein